MSIFVGVAVLLSLVVSIASAVFAYKAFREIRALRVPVVTTSSSTVNFPYAR